jgi:hypothetical protein
MPHGGDDLYREVRVGHGDLGGLEGPVGLLDRLDHPFQGVRRLREPLVLR